MTRMRFDSMSLVEVDDATRTAWKDASERRMARIDALPQEVRLLVHHYGWEPVKLLLDLGIKRPRQIEHIIRAIRMLGQEEEDRVLPGRGKGRHSQP